MPDEMEVRLKQALRRREPSAGFVDRVLARAGVQERRAWPVWRAATAVAAMLAVTVGYQDYRQRQAEEARRQTALALKITAEKLQQMRVKVLALQVRIVERENP